MPESVYQPKHCAFHPKELIFNFCKNSECLLPLCPTCIDVHSEEHKQQKTYGKFENMHHVVNEIVSNFNLSYKELDSFTEEIKDQIYKRAVDEAEVRRKMTEAKERVIGLVDRFFVDFEKEVNKSLLEFNVSMKESYKELEAQIKTMKLDLKVKDDNLATDKVLKTVISYYSKEEQKKIENNLEVMRETLDICGNQKAELIIETASIQKMVNELTQFMYISFENWEQNIKYVADFVKTGFSQSNSRTCSLHSD